MISERVRAIRKELGMTQAKFGESLGVSNDVVKNLEYGRVAPTDLIINMICARFNVNEQWLRTGEGNMFRELSEDEELAGLFGDLLSKDPPKTAKLKKRLIIKLLKLDDQQFEAAIKFARDFLGKDDE